MWRATTRPTRRRTRRRANWVWSVFERLGLKRNAQKGQPDPTQLLNDHLGYRIDSARGLFLLTAKREAGLAAQATELMPLSAAAAARLPPPPAA